MYRVRDVWNVVKKELLLLRQMASSLCVRADPWECVLVERGSTVPFSVTLVRIE